MKKAVFLDRDGVINETIWRDGKARAPELLADFRLIAGVSEAVKNLKSAGFVLVVVTNQPDVARGWQRMEVVESMNQHVRDQLKVDAVLTCFHDDHHACDCRKPNPGMLIEASRMFNLEMSQSFMVGDRYSDIQAGILAKCRTVLIGPGDGAPTSHFPDFRADSLLQAGDWILKNSSGPDFRISRKARD